MRIHLVMAGLSHFVITGSDRKKRFFFSFVSLPASMVYSSLLCVKSFSFFLHLDSLCVFQRRQNSSTSRFLLIILYLPPRITLHVSGPTDQLQLFNGCFSVTIIQPQLSLFVSRESHFIPSFARPALASRRAVRTLSDLHPHSFPKRSRSSSRRIPLP